jgi:dolichol-phosphate mannosyltransferase
MARELSIIIPTYNERDNIALLMHKLRAALAGIDWEVVFVDDDSSDGTAACLEQECAGDGRVRLIRRKGRRGLSSACIEGLLAAKADYLAVMDADMQHDETILPQMLAVLKAKRPDVVIASRYMHGASLGIWPQNRAVLSRAATCLTRSLTGIDISDPLSGYFMLRREFFLSVAFRLRGAGYKILLDIMTSSQAAVTFCEIPYIFRPRQHGKSKLSIHIVTDYAMYVAAYLTKRFTRGNIIHIA